MTIVVILIVILIMLWDCTLTIQAVDKGGSQGSLQSTGERFSATKDIEEEGAGTSWHPGGNGGNHRIRRKAEQQFCEDKDSVEESLALLMGCNAPAPVGDTAVDARVPGGYVLK